MNCFKTLVAWCVLICLALGASFSLDSYVSYAPVDAVLLRVRRFFRMLGQLGPSVRCGGTFRCRPLICEAVTAIFLTLVCVAGLVPLSILQRGCGYFRLLSCLVLASTMLLGGFLSLVLWMRLAVAYAEMTFKEYVALQRRRPMANSYFARHVSPAEAPEGNFNDEGRFARTVTESRSPLLLEDLQAYEVEGDSSCSVTCASALEMSQRVLRLFSRLRSCRGFVMMVIAAVLGYITCERDEFGDYETFAAELDTRWGFLIGSDSDVWSPIVAPVWLGEFGTDEDDLWWHYMLRFIREREIDFAYWPLNGQKTVGEEETYGLFSLDSLSVRHPWKLKGLQGLINSTTSA